MNLDFAKFPLGYGKGWGWEEAQLSLLPTTGLYECKYLFIWNYPRSVTNFQTGFSENN